MTRFRNGRWRRARRDDYTAAARLYEAMQELAPRSGEIFYNRGTIALEMNAFDRAVALFSRAEDNGFAEARLYYNRGNAYFHGGTSLRQFWTTNARWRFLPETRRY